MSGQVSNTSNITIQRPSESAPTRPAGQGSRPPALTKDAFPSLGRPAAAASTASWVTKKSEPVPRAAPKPAAPAVPPPPAAGDFPTLGPVAAHGNFGNFRTARGGGSDSASAAWSGAGEPSAKGKKKKARARPAGGENGAAEATSALNGLSLRTPAAARAADGSFQYLEPDNFAERNGRLVHQARELFGSGIQFDAFKTLSSELQSAETARAGE